MSPGLKAALENLAKLNQRPEFAAAFTRALTEAAVSRTHNFIKGIKAYREHEALRDVEEAPIIWQDGTTKLRDYNPKALNAPVVLVIPSLINRFDILDLDMAPSFLRNLAAQGFRPLVVDWDWPGKEEAGFGLSEYVTRRLMPVLDFILGRGTWDEGRAKDSNPPSPIPRSHVLGYCMGGLLALALAALRPDAVKTLTLMATPWDFHQPDPALGPQFSAIADQMEPTMQTAQILPVDVIQALFASLQPLQVLTKFSEFSAMDMNSPEARQFVLVEDWLNDGVPLTANVARECLRDWYGENFTARGEWHVDGKIIDPAAVKMPSYVIVPGKDKIVPPESALPLARLLPHSTLHEPMLGHIGMMASKNAAPQVWASLVHWLKEHS